MVPSTRTHTCMDRSSVLAKLSCTPAQHIGMLAESTSWGRAVTLGGATQGRGRNMELTNTTKLASSASTAHRGQSRQQTLQYLSPLSSLQMPSK